MCPLPQTWVRLQHASLTQAIPPKQQVSSQMRSVSQQTPLTQRWPAPQQTEPQTG
jgi:hypothetical protein